MKKIFTFLLLITIFSTSYEQDIQYPVRYPEDNPDFYESCQESIQNQTGNPFCKCKKSTTYRYLRNQLLVSPVCLPISVTSQAGGGIFGNIGARILWTYKGENQNTGAPLETESTVIDSNTIAVTWAEDQGGYSYDPNKLRTHITEINISKIPRVTRDIVLNGCVMNGGIVYNKNNGNLVTLCPKLCPQCPAYSPPSTVLDMHIIEVNLTSFQIVQDYSVMLPTCIPNSQYCYQGSSGTAFRYLKHDPVNDRYAVSHNSGWGVHVADSLIIVDAKTRQIIPDGGYAWACGSGHTEGVKIAYSPNTPGGFVSICTTDDSTYGLVYNQLYPKINLTKLAPQRIWKPQGSITWPGSLVSCGNYVYAAWHGVQTDGLPIKTGNDPEPLNEEIDIVFARIEASTGNVEKIVWMTNGNGRRNKNAKIAPLSLDCSSFLFGWGEGEVNSTELYPTKYYVVEIDMDGKQTSPVKRVDQYSIWYEDTEWITLQTGGVLWTTTWRRIKTNGQPRHMPLQFDGYMNTKAFKDATFDGFGYGFFWDPNIAVTQRFKTNELFVSIYKKTPMKVGVAYVPPVINIPSNYCTVNGDDRYIYSQITVFHDTFNCVNNTWVDLGNIGSVGYGRCRDDSSGKIQFYVSGKNYTLGDGSFQMCGSGFCACKWTAIQGNTLVEDDLEIEKTQ